MPRRKLTSPRRRTVAQRRPGRSLPISASLPDLLEAFKAAPNDIVRGLAVGESLLRHKLEKKIVDTLAHLEAAYPFRDPRHADFFNRIIALGYAHKGDFPGAERIIERALRDFGPSLDIHFVQAYSSLSMREYEKAEKAAAAFERLYESTGSDDRATMDFCRTAGCASQIANFRGIAAAQAGNIDQAEAAYRRSIKNDPGNHLPYLNLINLLRARDRAGDTQVVLDAGLKQARQVTELRMLQESSRNSVRISACMIVKNEEELLAGCLDSIRDWVHEIILVDTGSTDRTVDIARQYGAKILHQPWTGDFSHHRNYSIEQATGDWIFIIDADERVFAEDVPLILRNVNQSEYDILSLNLYNVYRQATRRVTFANSVRFFRRELNLRYEGIVHNDLVLPRDKAILRTRIRMEHLGYDLEPEKMKRKFERTRDLLQKQLAEDPDNTFALFNYSELLRGVDPTIQTDNAREIIRAAGRVVQLTAPDDPNKRHLHLMCLNQMATAHLALDEPERALDACSRALEIKPDYLDAIISRGMARHRLKQYQDAIAEFERYLEAQAAFDGAAEMEPIILSHPDSRDLAHNNLGILYQLTGRPDQARRHYLEALDVNPAYRETASLLGVLSLKEGKGAEAEVWFRHQLEHSEPTRESMIGLAQICLSDGRDEEGETFLNRALAAFPDDPNIRLEQGRFLLTRSRFDEAAGLFETLLDTGSSPEIIRHIADLFYEAGDLDHAARFYDRALQTGTISAELLNNVGNCHYKQGSYEEAIRWYQRAAELAPENLLALRNLGLAQVRLGHADEAITALRRCLDRDPEAFEIAHLLADQYRALGYYDDAVRLYEQVLRQRPTNHSALFSLSESYLLMGHSDSALAGYRRVLELKPGFQPAVSRVAELSGTAVTG